jgi:hypothetical protein
MADGVTYHVAEGVERRQKADMIVVACNGVGTAPLLVVSRPRQLPGGLANASRLVGKDLMLSTIHPVTGIFDEPLHGDRASLSPAGDKL